MFTIKEGFDDTSPIYDLNWTACHQPFLLWGRKHKKRQLERQFLARIGANESVFGPSPLACDAIRLEADAIWQYGDPENFDLKTALAQKT